MDFFNRMPSNSGNIKSQSKRFHKNALISLIFDGKRWKGFTLLNLDISLLRKRFK